MAGDWIKMRTNLDTDPAVVRISSALNSDRYSVVGRLHKLWAWANEHLTNGQNVPVDAAFLDSLVDCPGFAAEMRHVDWLSGRDGCLSFPGFEKHNGVSAKKRAQDASRKHSVRKMSAKCPPAKRTESGPEKRREEKSNNNRKVIQDKPPIVPRGPNATPPVLEAWGRFMEHIFCRQGNYPTDLSLDAWCMKLSRMASPEQAEEAINFSIEKQAKSLIEPNTQFGKPKNFTPTRDVI